MRSIRYLKTNTNNISLLANSKLFYGITAKSNLSIQFNGCGWYFFPSTYIWMISLQREYDYFLYVYSI